MFDLPEDYQLLTYQKCDSEPNCTKCPMNSSKLICIAHIRPAELTISDRKKILAWLEEDNENLN